MSSEQHLRELSFTQCCLFVGGKTDTCFDSSVNKCHYFFLRSLRHRNEC